MLSVVIIVVKRCIINVGSLDNSLGMVGSISINSIIGEVKVMEDGDHSVFPYFNYSINLFYNFISGLGVLLASQQSNIL